MSGTDTDPVTCVVLGVVALLELVVILPVVLAFQALMFAGRGAVALGQRRRLLLDPGVREELQRVAIERNAAIREIVAIQQRSEQELRAIAKGGE